MQESDTIICQIEELLAVMYVNKIARVILTAKIAELRHAISFEKNTRAEQVAVKK